MKYVFFTKMLQGMSIAEMADFITKAGFDGVDLTIRPGFPVTPENVVEELPKVKKGFEDAGLTMPMVSLPTNAIDPTDKQLVRIFETCGKIGIGYAKLGYFRFTGRYGDDLKQARQRLAGFAQLAQSTGVRACYHTHTGTYIGSNCAGQRELLADLDPHSIGSYVDTMHQTLGGCPFPMGLDMVGEWLALIATKDAVWVNSEKGWRWKVVPVGTGIVNWPQVRQGLKQRHYEGVISIHAEYEVEDPAKRLPMVTQEVQFLKTLLASK